MKKRFMLFVVCLLLLTGCGKLQETEQEEEKQDDTPVQIGLVFDSFVIERWQKDQGCICFHCEGIWCGSQCAECQR